MKKIFLLLLVMASVGIAYYFARSTEPPFELEDGYTLLYDGESLAGWRAVGGEATFEPDGSAIVGRHGPGDNSFLRTEQTYGDFSLKLQMRWDETGNSGVMFRAQQRGGDGRVFGYQYELDPSDRAWTGGIYDEARRGWIANLEDNEAARSAIRLGDWNDVEIEARGASLKTWINGVPAADTIDGLTAEGFIALQVHSGKEGVIRWRNIRIREFAPVLEEGESLLNAEQWREAPASLQFEERSLSGAFEAKETQLASRRHFYDAMVRMTVPACEEPTIIHMRHRNRGTGEVAGFAEVKIFADRAEGRLFNIAGETTLEPVELNGANEHTFIGLVRGDELVLTVDEVDAMRVQNSGLEERGQLKIWPARCADDFTLGDLAWYSLKEEQAEPLFYQTLEVPPAPVLTPEEALQAFRIAPGFSIELVAAEPLVEEPVAMAWDEYGRLYVVEMRGYMRDAYGTDGNAPVGQVVRLEDVDGDGRMDKSEVFLGELVNPRAVAVVNEGILIGEPPNLWLCELPTKDALCTDKRSVGGYATDASAANVEHMENGLRQGLDNWLYNSKSNRRLRLVEGALESQEGLYRGQWGITKDNVGRLLYNHNSTWIQADYFQAEDLIIPGSEAYASGLGVNLTESADVYSVRVNPGVNRAYLDGTLREDGRLAHATGASGIVVYRGDQFPQEYQGDVFVPESAGNVVAQFAMAEEGMAMTASQRLYDDPDWGQRGFLGSTDERFRPVDAMNGPDGALYIIDMYRGIIQDDHFLTDELREQIFQRQLDTPIGMGRIWRIRHDDGKAERTAVDLSGLSDQMLVAALSHDNGWVRDTAQRLLLARDSVPAQTLAGVAHHADTIPALHAIWTLHGRGELSPELIVALASVDDPHRQVHILRAGAGLLDAPQLLALSGLLADAPEPVAMQLALAMSAASDNISIRAALAELLATHASSQYLRQAVVRAVQGRELEFLRELFAAGSFSQPSEANSTALAELTANAYRALRGDLSSTEPAPTELLALLDLMASRRFDNAWQQVAMLRGLEELSGSNGFAPASLAAIPPIFSDGSISEKDPLWEARLAGRRAFTWPGDELAMGVKPLSPEQLKAMAQGETFYVQCAACHGEDGRGVSGLAPALAGASWVTGPSEWLGRIILQGMTGPVEVNGEVFDGVMPPHGHIAELDDTTLAGLMTYLRRSWGNKADPVSVETVTQIRAGSADRDTPWTAEDIRQVPYDRGFTRFEGQFAISFVTITIEEKEDGLHMSVPMYGSGKLEQLSDTKFRGRASGEDVRLEFVVETDGSVNKMILLRKGERLTIRRKT